MSETDTMLSGWEEAANQEEQLAACDDTYPAGWYRTAIRKLSPKQAADWSAFKGESILNVQVDLVVDDKKRVNSFDVAFEKRKTDKDYVAMEYVNFSKLCKGLKLTGLAPKEVFEKLESVPFETKWSRSPIKKDGEETGAYRNNFQDARPDQG